MCFNHLAHALLIILEPIDIKKEENGDDVSELFNVKKKKVETKGQIRYKHWKEFNPLIKEYLRNLNVVRPRLLAHCYLVCTSLFFSF